MYSFGHNLWESVSTVVTTIAGALATVNAMEKYLKNELKVKAMQDFY